MCLLLSEEQREHVETWLAQRDPDLSVMELYRQMIESHDRKLFTDWQLNWLKADHNSLGGI